MKWANTSPGVNTVGLNLGLFVFSLLAFVISVSHLARSGKMGMSVFVKIKVSCPPFSLAPNPADQQRTPVD